MTPSPRTVTKRKRLKHTDPDYEWSFSSITSYLECPYQFKLNYIDGVQDIGNAFSDYGNLVHEILEKWAKGELMDFELVDYYEKNYASAMHHDYPPYPVTMAESSYHLGAKFFQHFTGFGEDFEIISAEEKFSTTIGPYKFRGISDLVLRNVKNGTYCVVDHKTKSPTSMKKDLELYTKQLYIYAKYVHDKFGVYPNIMMFNMIKDQTLIIEKFNMDKFLEVMDWVIDSIGKILAETKWGIGGSSYFCQNICSYRQACEFSDRFKTEWTRKQEQKQNAENERIDNAGGI
jgi:hypothetical protein